MCSDVSPHSSSYKDAEELGSGSFLGTGDTFPCPAAGVARPAAPGMARSDGADRRPQAAAAGLGLTVSWLMLACPASKTEAGRTAHGPGVTTSAPVNAASRLLTTCLSQGSSDRTRPADMSECSPLRAVCGAQTGESPSGFRSAGWNSQSRENSRGNRNRRAMC